MHTRSMARRGLAVILGSSALCASAQQTDQVQRVEITGSSLKRIDAETAFAVTVVKADELARKGITTVEEALGSLSMNQQLTVGAGSVGLELGGKASANLRGLGDGRTLVLLNGRRLANHPFDGASVDLYTIPFAAIDRIEVLRDGASHIYGTDAISGVVNFITKRSLDETTLTAEDVTPQQSGAREKRASLTTGYGKLQQDGFNVMLSVDAHKQGRMSVTERPFSQTGILPEYGIKKTSGTTFPANFFSANGITGNPGFANGCLSPDSIPDTASKTCRQDYARFVDAVPESKQVSLLGRASMKIGSGSLATLEYLHSESDNISRIAPPPMTNLIMHSTSKWYPGGAGGTPAVAGLSGEDLTIAWRTVEGGRREATINSASDRVVAAISGDVMGWDVSAAVTAAQTKVKESLTGGYLNDVKIQQGINDGILNPFALQDTAGKAYLDGAAVRGQVVESTARNTGVDVHATRDLMDLPAGPLGLALGAEARNERSDYLLQRGPLDQLLISRANGLVSAKDTSGERSMSAFFAEANVPIVKSFEMQLAARYDHYSDAGNTFNPKIGFRYQPVRQWLLRGSANSGFRAPTLYELNGPVVDNITSRQYDDPVLCPGGVPKAGVNPLLACGANLRTRTGGNPQLAPERARSYSIGTVFEPSAALTLSLDLSQIKVRNTVGVILDEETILGDYEKYKDRFHYSADGKTLDYINVSTLGNGGERMTRVLDLTGSWRLPAMSIGSFDTWFNGTYVLKDTVPIFGRESQDNIGVYNGTVRWRHNIAVRWTDGPWSLTLSQRYSKGYRDQNTGVAAEFYRDVAANSVWTLSGSYTGFQHWTLNAGIKNLLNTDPPFSNQAPNPQTGYDPRFADPVGRALYLRASYKF